MKNLSRAGAASVPSQFLDEVARPARQDIQVSARILVAEDDPKQGNLVRVYLEREGHSVLVVGDGRTALEQARARKPDLLVLDVMMPSVDGLDVCRILRAESNVAILLVTARSSENDMLLGLDIGADDYLSKPVSPRELTARIRALLRRVELHPQVWQPGLDPGLVGQQFLLRRVAIRSSPARRWKSPCRKRVSATCGRERRSAAGARRPRDRPRSACRRTRPGRPRDRRRHGQGDRPQRPGRLCHRLHPRRPAGRPLRALAPRRRSTLPRRECCSRARQSNSWPSSRAGFDTSVACRPASPSARAFSGS